MKKYYIFLLGLALVLAGCGNKYEKEINSVAKVANKDISNDDKEFVKYNKDKANTYVYDDGNIIIINYKAIKGSNTKVYDLYKKIKLLMNMSMKVVKLNVIWRIINLIIKKKI